MYLSDVQQFGGERDIVSKFGIQLTDRINLVVSKTRFQQEVSSKETDVSRPREGDLIYFPMMEYMFEINFVEDKQPFFQFGKLTTYNLSCEVFHYSHESINTGNTDIDSTETERKEFLKLLTLGATAYGGTYNFSKGERVYQVYGVTGSSALYSNADAIGIIVDQATEYNYTTGLTANSLYIGDITGTFTINNSVRGLTSGVEFDVTGVTNSNIVIARNPESEDPDRDNDILEYKAKADSIFDFTDKDPFSEGSY
jgi:hypothetical protein